MVANLTGGASGDADDGVRTLLLLNCDTYPTSFEEDDLREFTNAHYHFFYSRGGPDRMRVEILWPKVEHYYQLWQRRREGDYWAAGKEMTADLEAAKMTAPMWPPPEVTGEDLSGLEDPF